jgi:hypothetical protein
MKWDSKSRLIATVGVLGGALLLGCRDETPETLAPDLGPDRITPQCQLGCTDPDPEPDADGYFLGKAMNPAACASTSSVDTDGDGLSDFCEKNLAAAFAPQLYYYSADEVGREPHWVARPLSASVIRIVYLLSYYRDAGSNVFGCSVPFAPSSCNGHHGDSEAIALDVIYNTKNGHWMLRTARYSQHGEFMVYDAVNCTPYYPSGCIYLIYPDGVRRGFPRAYVSQGKHANYASVRECNNGGTLDSDTCQSVNATARVAAAAYLNIGSRAVHTDSQDCMLSSNPSYRYYGSGRKECYWTTRRFRGWVPTTQSGADSDPYSNILVTLSF